MAKAVKDSTIAIRQANASDAEHLARMRYGFRADVGFPSEPEESFVERCRRWMERRLGEGSRWRCWLAEEKGAVVGHIWVQVIEKIPNPVAEAEEHAYISNFHVLEARRGKGVGSRLLSGALGWCRDNGVHAVILWPTERSRRLYERYGFAVRQDLMALDLMNPGEAGGAREEPAER